jgi:hypothetical protein
MRDIGDVSAVSIIKDLMRDEILQASERQLIDYVRDMHPDYRTGFCKTLIDHLMTIPLESPHLQARRERMCLTLAAFAMDEENTIDDE